MFLGLADNIFVDTPGIANTGAAGWVPQSGGVLATMAVDWVIGRAWNSGITTPGALFSCTRATPVAAYYQNADLTLSTFAANTLRYGSSGLLVEEARTNLLTDSQRLDNATSWTVQAASIVADQVAAPDGTTTADKILIDGTSNLHCTYQSPTFSIDTAYGISIYLKYLNTQYAGVRIFDAVNTKWVVVDLQNGTITKTDAGVTSALDTLANGWYRLRLVYTSAHTASGGNIVIAHANSSSYSGGSYVGNSTDAFYAWGAQLEAGAFATSYIPTTTVSVTRAADLVLSTTANFIGSTSDTVYTQFKLLDISDVRGLFELVGTASIDGRTQGGSVVFQSIGTGFDAITANSASINISQKAAMAVAANDMAVCLNAGTVAVDATGTMLSAPTSFQVGDVDGAVTKPINGFILFDAVWKDSRLSNAELQRLTT